MMQVVIGERRGAGTLSAAVVAGITSILAVWRFAHEIDQQLLHANSLFQVGDQIAAAAVLVRGEDGCTLWTDRYDAGSGQSEVTRIRANGFHDGSCIPSGMIFGFRNIDFEGIDNWMMLSIAKVGVQDAVWKADREPDFETAEDHGSRPIAKYEGGRFGICVDVEFGLRLGEISSH